jgi:hypothetical protein
MTDSTNSMSELPALLQERHRYETWLTALDARHDSTSQHVFARVQADYQGRLDRVEEQIEAHRNSIEEERASLESRLSLLKAEEQLRRDERAELELRAHVGELEGAEAEKAFRAVDEVIEHLVGEKSQLEGRIGELNAILEIRPRNTPAPSAPAAQPVAAAPPPPPQPAPRPSAPSQPAARAAGAHSIRESAVREAPVKEPPVQRSSQQTRVPKATPGDFDELAFLSQVVGDKDRSSNPSMPPFTNSGQAQASIGRNEAAPESLLAGLDDTSRRTSGEAPFAANVSGNIPIVLRNSGQTEQTKTLKCGECGTMNYPTEWYCERCGAELAAL